MAQYCTLGYPRIDVYCRRCFSINHYLLSCVLVVSHVLIHALVLSLIPQYPSISSSFS